MKKVSVITNFNIPGKADVAEKVIKKFLECGAEVAAPYYAKGRVDCRIPVLLPGAKLYDNADMIVVIGGDGSVLDAARRAAERETPILGINKGRLGYMTELEINELDLIEKIMRGEYKTEERSMLKVQAISGTKVFHENRALNDAVISNGAVARMVDLEVYEDGNLIDAYRADGMIVSTPTGSTAYSLSAGGPVIDPRVKGVCITPVCAHSLVSRAMVFPSESVIEVKNTCEREPNLFLTIDGRVNIRLDHGNIVRVTSSEKVTKLIRVKAKNKYSEIFKKLYL